MKYIKKLETIQAWEVGSTEIPTWVDGKFTLHVDGCVVELENQVRFLKNGDWLALHPNGDYEIIAPDMFKKLYNFIGLE